MKLGVSSIAWQDGEEQKALPLLESHGVETVELVPRRVAGDPPGNETAWKAAREEWCAAGLTPCAFQAILYGYPQPMHVFQGDEEGENLFNHLAFVCEAAGALGVGAIVFGSPKQRWIDDERFSKEEAYNHAVQFFRRVGAVAEQFNTCVCMEPNPEAYNCNFLTHTMDAAQFVRTVDAPGIGLNVDAGTLAMNEEPVPETWEFVHDVVRHVHISDPFLKPVGSGSDNVHRMLARTLVQAEYTGVISLEMGRSGDDTWQSDLDRALGFVREVYYES